VPATFVNQGVAFARRRLKMCSRARAPLLADNAGDPQLSGSEHALIFRKLPRQARKAGACSRRQASSKRNCSNWNGRPSVISHRSCWPTQVPIRSSQVELAAVLRGQARRTIGPGPAFLPDEGDAPRGLQCVDREAAIVYTAAPATRQPPSGCQHRPAACVASRLRSDADRHTEGDAGAQVTNAQRQRSAGGSSREHP
jgi:hypothetical protein